MRLTAKPVFFGTPVLIAVGTFILLWMLMGAGSAGGGVSDNIKYEGIVTYEVRDAAGNLKQFVTLQNTTIPATLLEDASDYLSIPSTTLSETTAYDNVQACTGTQGTPTDCETGTNALLLQLDGVAAGAAGGNPEDMTADNTGDGVYKVTANFTCNTNSGAGGGSACTAISQLQLTKSVVVDGTAAAPSDVGAYKDVAITLDDLDTLAVAWTITIS